MKHLFPILILIYFSSCALYSAYTKDAELKGIPVLPIVTVSETTEKYFQEWMEISLTSTIRTYFLTEANKLAHKESNATAIIYTEKQEVATALKNLFAIESTKPSDLANKKILKYFKRCIGDIPSGVDSRIYSMTTCTPPALVKLSQIDTLSKLSVHHSFKQIPASKPIYVNVDRPIFGDATGKLTINSNGTLASIEGSVSDKTLEQILSNVPIADLFSSDTPETEPAEADENKSTGVPSIPPPQIVKLSLTIVTYRRVYSFSVIRKPEFFGKPISNRLEASMLISVEKSGQKKQDKKDDSKAIKINGTISLPKEKDAK